VDADLLTVAVGRRKHHEDLLTVENDIHVYVDLRFSPPASLTDAKYELCRRAGKHTSSRLAAASAKAHHRPFSGIDCDVPAAKAHQRGCHQAP